MPDEIKLDELKLSPGAVVSLITIDATRLGGNRLTLTTGPLGGNAVVFDAVSYRALPVRVTGVRTGGRSSQPTLEVASEDTTLLLALGTDDLRGAGVRRIQTLGRYLDGQAEADTDRHWPEDSWIIDQMLERKAATIRWRLASPLTWDASHLPPRQVLRKVCSFIYRRWNAAGNAWDYTEATCPYRGVKKYNVSNAEVNPADEDECSRTLAGCRVRFQTGALPFGGFPGAGRVR